MDCLWRRFLMPRARASSFSSIVDPGSSPPSSRRAASVSAVVVGLGAPSAFARDCQIAHAPRTARTVTSIATSGMAKWSRGSAFSTGPSVVGEYYSMRVKLAMESILGAGGRGWTRLPSVAVHRRSTVFPQLFHCCEEGGYAEFIGADGTPPRGARACCLAPGAGQARAIERDRDVDVPDAGEAGTALPGLARAQPHGPAGRSAGLLDA